MQVDSYSDISNENRVMLFADYFTDYFSTTGYSSLHLPNIWTLANTRSKC